MNNYLQFLHHQKLVSWTILWCFCIFVLFLFIFNSIYVKDLVPVECNCMEKSDQHILENVPFFPSGFLKHLLEI